MVGFYNNQIVIYTPNYGWSYFGYDLYEGWYFVSFNLNYNMLFYSNRYNSIQSVGLSFPPIGYYLQSESLLTFGCYFHRDYSNIYSPFENGFLHSFYVDNAY